MSNDTRSLYFLIGIVLFYFLLQYPWILMIFLPFWPLLL